MAAKKKQAQNKQAVQPTPVAAKAPAPAETKKEPAMESAPVAAVPDVFEQAGKYGIFLALGLLLLVAVVVFNAYLFGDKPYCFTDIASDSLNLSYPNIVNLADYIAKYGWPKWSFQSGMGQSIFPFFLRDPFDIFLYLSGRNSVLGGLVYLEVIKITLAGLAFFRFLRLINITPFTATLGALFFSFSGFMIMGSAWYGFTYEALCLALFLVAFELGYQKGNWLLIPVVVALIALSMPFNLYVYGLFVLAYAIFRHLINPDTTGFQKLGTSFVVMAAVGVIGLLLAGPFLLENIVQILESPRGSGNTSLTGKLSARPVLEVSDKIETATNILRFFSNDILGSALSFKGWKNILEAGSFYCGLPCLLLMPQVFPSLGKKQRTIFIVFITLWILPMFFPYFRHAFWLFSGDYYRGYAFFVAIVFILYSVYALDHILKTRQLNLVILGISLALLLMLLNYPWFEEPDMVNGTVKSFASIFLVIYAAVLFLIARPQSMPALKYVFMGLVVLELCYISGVTTNGWEAYAASDPAQKAGYSDHTVDAIKYIKERDKTFFRVDKSYGSSTAVFNSINDGMVQNYYGTSSYNPFNQLYYIYNMQLMGVSNSNDETATRWCLGTLYKPVLQSVNQVKYILAKNRINPFWRLVCDSLTTMGDVTVFRNRFALPLGFTYSRYIKESDFEKVGEDQKSLLSLKACIIKDKDEAKATGLTPYNIKDTTMFDLNQYATDVAELSKEHLQLTQFNDNELTGNITTTGKKIIYLSIPWDGGWKAFVDGKEQERLVLSAGMTGLVVGPGSHSIAMRYDLRYFQPGIYMFIAGIAAFAVLAFFWARSKKTQQY